jgi:prepilin-type N-terminal cleavage/methylation domain-containing protein
MTLLRITRRRRPVPPGLTLLEMIVAIALSGVVILAIGQFDVSRVRIASTMRALGQPEGGLALLYMARSLQSADQVVLVSPTTIKFRQFTGDPTIPGALNAPANYTWRQYRFVNCPTGQCIELRRSSGCVLEERFHNVSSLAMAHQDRAGTPAPDMNNMEIVIDGRHRTEVILRDTSDATIASTAMGLSPNPPSPGTC